MSDQDRNIGAEIFEAASAGACVALAVSCARRLGWGDVVYSLLETAAILRDRKRALLAERDAIAKDSKTLVWRQR